MRYPVPEHETWGLVDASKLQTFMECPRRYFYRYILGWETEQPNHHLIFGQAWHKAMELILLHGLSEKTIAAAYAVFHEHYRKHFPAESDDERKPKTPENAAKALAAYLEVYGDERLNVQMTEVAGTVPIGDAELQVLPTFQMYFRLDSVIKDDVGAYYSLEHKTASRLSRQWTDQWLLSLQVGLYTHVLYCLYEPEQVWGVRINGAVFRSNGVELVRIPVRKTPAAMQNWLWNTQTWFLRLDQEMVALSEASESDAVMRAFPMNCTNCTKYYGCPYLDFCFSWENPLRRCQDVQPGFVESWWDPRDREKEAKFLIEDGKPVSAEEAQTC